MFENIKYFFKKIKRNNQRENLAILPPVLLARDALDPDPRPGEGGPHQAGPVLGRLGQQLVEIVVEDVIPVLKNNEYISNI